MGLRRGAHLPDIGRWARRWIDHWVCDAWPVRCQTYGYLPSCRASPPFGRYRTKLYCLVTEAHGCEQLAQSCYLVADWPGVELATFRSRANALTTEPPSHPHMMCQPLFSAMIEANRLTELSDCLIYLKHACCTLCAPSGKCHCTQWPVCVCVDVWRTYSSTLWSTTTSRSRWLPITVRSESDCATRSKSFPTNWNPVRIASPLH